MTNSNKVWGYSKNGPRMFDLAEGEDLPKGYLDSPAKLGKASKTVKKEAEASVAEPETEEE